MACGDFIEYSKSNESQQTLRGVYNAFCFYNRNMFLGSLPPYWISKLNNDYEDKVLTFTWCSHPLLLSGVGVAALLALGEHVYKKGSDFYRVH